MSANQNIQWFPGHMTKTKRMIEASLKLVDAVIEIKDARIPVSSTNPDIDGIIGAKPRLILLNKCDVADKNSTNRWIDYYKQKGIKALAIDCRSGKGLNLVVPECRKLLKSYIEKKQARGIKNPSIRVMIVGIPNVGKSSFINKVVKQNRAKVEDRPGVTRGNQWFTLDRGFELLDTPGVLWPKFEDQTVGERLAFTGAVKDQILDTELLAVRLLDLLKELKPPMFLERFSLNADTVADMESFELLELIGRKRGMLISGGEVNTERASAMLLDEFRAAKLGKITLELPEE
ncbi:MAG: ribosome biogenesis GTPase YlqF [Ruminococcaceae bacterium]|nr:ribosome biogenesis GTPase YlqF [Oscillospiraceae bacterium]